MLGVLVFVLSVWKYTSFTHTVLNSDLASECCSASAVCQFVSILTKWPVHLNWPLTCLPVRLYYIPLGCDSSNPVVLKDFQLHKTCHCNTSSHNVQSAYKRSDKIVAKM